jgi:DNA-binding transcriptional LysR family regulator
MDIRHLQALLGIADSGSFSGAAEALGTVQSNVSAQIARLEKELQAALVDRSSGRLTQEGEVVAARARRVMAELEAMVADVAALRDQVMGTVRVGMIGTTSRWLVPQLFAHVRKRHPLVRLSVVDGTNTTLGPQLVSGRLDLAVVSLPVIDEDVVVSSLFEEDLVLVVAADDPLAREAGRGAGPLPLSTLKELELLLPLPGTALRDEIDTAIGGQVTLQPSMELDGVRLIASLTFDGYGPAILPASSVPTTLRERFALFALEGLPRRRVGVALRKRGLPSAAVRTVIDALHGITSVPSGLPEGLHPATAKDRVKHGGRGA